VQRDHRIYYFCRRSADSVGVGSFANYSPIKYYVFDLDKFEWTAIQDLGQNFYGGIHRTAGGPSTTHAGRLTALWDGQYIHLFYPGGYQESADTSSNLFTAHYSVWDPETDTFVVDNQQVGFNDGIDEGDVPIDMQIDSAGRKHFLMIRERVVSGVLQGFTYVSRSTDPAGILQNFAAIAPESEVYTDGEDPHSNMILFTDNGGVEKLGVVYPRNIIWTSHWDSQDYNYRHVGVAEAPVADVPTWTLHDGYSHILSYPDQPEDGPYPGGTSKIPRYPLSSLGPTDDQQGAALAYFKGALRLFWQTIFPFFLDQGGHPSLDFYAQDYWFQDEEEVTSASLWMSSYDEDADQWTPPERIVESQRKGPFNPGPSEWYCWYFINHPWVEVITRPSGEKRLLVLAGATNQNMDPTNPGTDPEVLEAYMQESYLHVSAPEVPITPGPEPGHNDTTLVMDIPQPPRLKSHSLKRLRLF
jgi:hypothetical protein